MRKFWRLIANTQGSRKENNKEERCCIKHLSPDYIFKLRVTMAAVTEREKRSSVYTGKRV
jgi:hypothetical protein